MTPTIVIVFSGAGQPKHISNGALDLVQKIEGMHLPGVETWYFRWVRRTSDVLALIRAWLTVHPDGRVVLAGHSFGGWRAAKVAAALDHPVYALVLTDPVGREPLMSDITLSPNVQNVYRYFQTEGTLHGSVVWHCFQTISHEIRISGVPHAHMDELPEWQEQVTSLAKEAA